MLIDVATSNLLIVDVQERTTSLMYDPRKVIGGCAALVHAAVRLEVPVTITELCPERNGRTMIDVRTLAPVDLGIARTTFSGADAPSLMVQLASLGRSGVVIAGLESHIAVLQTALGLNSTGAYQVFVVVDACAARQPASEQVAWQRLMAAGVSLVTIEMVLYEWLRHQKHPAFRDIQRMLP